MNMESPLTMVRRHVMRGSQLLARQREIVEELARHHHPTSEARRLLHLFEDVQKMHRAHLRRVLRRGRKPSGRKRNPLNDARRLPKVDATSPDSKG